jgi:hypothetical protein
VYRVNGIAATQVDFVGHSMGGLLARLYIGEYSPGGGPLYLYKRDDNLNAGDVHKLITLDTPHQGSELALALVDALGAITNFGAQLQPLMADKCFTCGAVFDLRVGSAMIQTMPQTPVPSHAIVGIGGQALLRTVEYFSFLTAIAAPEAALFGGYATLGLDYLTFGGQPHDMIVSGPSQAGGLTGGAMTVFDNEWSQINSDWLAVHTSVTHESRISTKVIDLLNAPARSQSFSRF